MPKPTFSGRVKFFDAEKGWGGIESAETPGDVWVHISVIDAPGFKALVAGDPVEFRYEAGQQDSWSYVATWVRKIDDHGASTAGPPRPRSRRKPVPVPNPLAARLAAAIRSGALDELGRLVGSLPGLADVRIAARRGTWRTPLHVVTHWPGYLPNGPAVVRLLIEAGADPSAELRMAELLLARGANIDASPGYGEGRTPLDIAGDLDERRSQLVRWLGEHGAAGGVTRASTR